MLHAAGASPAAAECSLRNWPGVQPSWRHGGASEKCFCAYAGGAPLDQACPHWKDYVSADGTHADKLSTYGRATIQGKRAGNATTSRYGSMTDWALDLGSGFGADCDRSRADQAVQDCYQFRHLRHLHATGQNDADTSTNEQRNEQYFVMSLYNTEDRRQQRDRHTDNAVPVAASCSFLVRQAAQRENKKNGRNDVRHRNYALAHYLNLTYGTFRAYGV